MHPTAERFIGRRRGALGARDSAWGPAVAMAALFVWFSGNLYEESVIVPNLAWGDVGASMLAFRAGSGSGAFDGKYQAGQRERLGSHLRPHMLFGWVLLGGTPD